MEQSIDQNSNIKSASLQGANVKAFSEAGMKPVTLQNVLITEPDKSQLQQLSALYSEAFSADPWFEKWTEESARQALEAFPYSVTRVTCLCREDQIVAFAIGLPFESSSARADRDKVVGIPEDPWYLAEFVVAKEFRGQGLGKKVLEAFIEDARAQGYTSFVTRTRSDNIAAIKPFSSVGLEAVGQYEAETGGVKSTRTVFVKN